MASMNIILIAKCFRTLLVSITQQRRLRLPPSLDRFHASLVIVHNEGGRSITRR
jgi:hypothetical protein